jgi:hypothetical protein
MGFELTADELERLERDGFVVREGVYAADEIAAIVRECEDLAREVVAVSHGTKHVVGSYMFERSEELEMYVKWEPGAPDVLQALEPFAHLSPKLRERGLDARLVDPMKTFVGQDDIELFTEKLNLKRARHGGKYILHQDFPYWTQQNPAAARVGTAMIMLDDANRENGCLEVAPGTHKEGVQRLRVTDGFGNREMDTDCFDHDRLRAVEVKAGSVIYFGSMLVHRSLPNNSDADRRALLYSYQPAGLPHATELARKRKLEVANWLASHPKAKA